MVTGDAVALNVNVYGPPAEPVTTHPAATAPESSCTAVVTVAAVALYAIPAVVWPPMVTENVPPVGVPTRVATCTASPLRYYRPDTPLLKYDGYPMREPAFVALFALYASATKNGRPLASTDMAASGRRIGSHANPENCIPGTAATFETPVHRSV